MNLMASFDESASLRFALPVTMRKDRTRLALAPAKSCLLFDGRRKILQELLDCLGDVLFFLFWLGLGV